ncbi:hypothetical protein H0H92_011448 [Tricholoma furcatifolium]|nr:hypothetical protein H0H92_011448 [Tricholoma furcatifolium]
MELPSSDRSVQTYSLDTVFSQDLRSLQEASSTSVIEAKTDTSPRTSVSDASQDPHTRLLPTLPPTTILQEIRDNEPLLAGVSDMNINSGDIFFQIVCEDNRPLETVSLGAKYRDASINTDPLSPSVVDNEPLDINNGDILFRIVCEDNKPLETVSLGAK